jgi:hypothetical protein
MAMTFRSMTNAKEVAGEVAQSTGKILWVHQTSEGAYVDDRPAPGAVRIVPRKPDTC